MVEEIDYRGIEHHYCTDCKLVYESIIWAENCEDWCRENESCNSEIPSHSIKRTLEELS